MSDETGIDTRKIKVLLGEAFDEHVRKEHIKVDSRLQFLEDRYEGIDEMNGRLLSLEVDFRETSGKVDSLAKGFTTFTTKAEERAIKFEKDINNSYSNFIRWMVGLILSSLIFGLFFQYKAFQDVHDNINDLEKKVLILNGSKVRKLP